MFDLIDSIKKSTGGQSSDSHDRVNTVLFYQTEPCRELVLEAYRFEGATAPSIAKNIDDDIVEYVRNSDIEIVIVELNKSSNVSADAERIRHLLPNHASVIIIGSEDAISTIRNLKSIGFYYLFWPVTKPELIDFVKSVSENRKRNSSRGPGQNRRAKYISIIGSKGGVGATLIAAEMAYQLSLEKKSSCLVVDQNYFTGNLDIMMSIENFERRSVQKGEITTSLDEAFAQSLIYRHSSMLSVLSLTSEQVDSHGLLDYTNAIIDFLAQDVNFVIEDCSASVGFSVASDSFVAQCDSIVLIVEPSVSSLRDAGKISESIQKINHNGALRLILVLNHSIPKKAATVSKQDVEEFLKQKVDIEIPYCDALSKTVLDGKRVAKSSLKAAKPMQALTSVILGEQAVKKPKRSLLAMKL